MGSKITKCLGRAKEAEQTVVVEVSDVRKIMSTEQVVHDRVASVVDHAKNVGADVVAAVSNGTNVLADIAPAKDAVENVIETVADVRVIVPIVSEDLNRLGEMRAAAAKLAADAKSDAKSDSKPDATK